MGDIVLEPGVEARVDPGLKFGCGRDQEQAAWVRTWPAMVFSDAEAVAA